MRSFFKRIIEFILLIVLLWFGSMIAYKENIQKELIYIRILTDTQTPAVASVVTQIQMKTLNFLENEYCNSIKASKKEAAASFNYSKLVPLLESVLKLNRINQKSSITVTETERSIQKFPDCFIPAGLYETIEVQIGTGDKCVIYEGIFQKCGLPLDISRLPDNRSILQNVALNCIGVLENTFHLE